MKSAHGSTPDKTPGQNPPGQKPFATAAAPPDILETAARRRRHNDVGARLDPGQNPQVKRLCEPTTNPLK